MSSAHLTITLARGIWAQANLPLTYDWVFHIDADERVSAELVAKLREFFNKNSLDQPVDGLLVRRLIEFSGRHIKHGGIYPTYHCRIFRKDRGRCEDREYDQHFIVDGPTLRLEADLVEITALSLYSWTARHNRWAQMEASRLLKGVEGGEVELLRPRLVGSPIERRRWFRARVYEKAPLFFRALAYFLERYVVRGGFLDGTPGLIYHFLHGFWFRFYVDACYYELQQRQRHNIGHTSTDMKASPPIPFERRR